MNEIGFLSPYQMQKTINQTEWVERNMKKSKYRIWIIDIINTKLIYLINIHIHSETTIGEENNEEENGAP